MRIGTGFDVHQLKKERRLILGGVDIPHATGLLGHSDADVLVHAIIDAILGALALGDIGSHFPDSDDRFRGISSLQLLMQTTALVLEKGWVVVNIDSVVMAERPRLMPFLPEMSARIAACLQIQPDQVSVKATTTEKLGFVGREEGIAAQAVALLTRATGNP